MKLLGSTKTKITKDTNGENMPNLKITTIVSVLFNNLNNDYQHDLGVLHTFLSIKLFGQLLNISFKVLSFFKTFHSEILHIEIWFTDQNSKLLGIEDDINTTLVIK